MFSGFGFIILQSFCVLPSAALDIEFGANTRSLDHANIFKTVVTPPTGASTARAAKWNSLFNNNIRNIVISEAMTSPFNPEGVNGTTRDPLTYLSSSDLANLATTMNRGSATDFNVIVEAGFGLSVKACSYTNNPSTAASESAKWEYDKILKPQYLDKNIPIREIDVDGPFLRLLANSKKEFSCADQNRGVFSSVNAGKVVRDYLKHLRNRIDNHPTHKRTASANDDIKVKTSITVNLPNWQVSGVKRLSSAGNTGDLTSATGVLVDFKSAMDADTGIVLEIERFSVDYPYQFVPNILAGEPLATGLTVFKNKVQHLRTRIGTIPRTGSNLTFITNYAYNLNPTSTDTLQKSIPGTVTCVWSLTGGNREFADEIPYLPYQNDDGITDSTCVGTQTTADDNNYFNKVAIYAKNIANGTWLHSNFPLGAVGAIRFYSWFEMPVSTFTSMDRAIRYKTQGN